MTVFSEVYDLDHILSIIKSNYHNILVIGCGGCTNESLAFSKKLPIMKDDDEAKAPIATNTELEKIQSQLRDSGFDVRTVSIPLGSNVLCISSDEINIQYNPNADFKPDVVLSLCCPAGTFGIENGFDKDIPVIQITRQLGQMAYYYYVKDGFQWIDYNRSKVFYSIPSQSQ